ncbi:MAG TPA: HAMP domain-containing protein, partial [Ilumatobacteraceae bacterium]|nr:HAMP domain-containing protein [Ilumatobacteraceae bacterium]
MNEGGWFRRLVNRSRPAALGLRRRILLIFTIGSLVLSVFLATTTYGLTRSNVERERIDTAINTSQRNAQGVERDLRSRPVDAEAARTSLTRIGVQDYLIWYDDNWSAGGATFEDADVPPPLATRVIDEGTSASQIVRLGDELNVVVGWDIPSIGAYFEAFSLDEADSTLSSVRLSLVLAAAITTGLGILLGIFSARRAVRPLGTAAQAASAIAGGRLDTRLETTDDPDLRILTESFNDMAA